MEIRNERMRLDFGYDLIPYLIDKGFSVYGYEINTFRWKVGSRERSECAFRCDAKRA